MLTTNLFIPLLLSEPTGVDPTPLYLVMLGAPFIILLAWWGGLKLLRSGKVVGKMLGALVLLFGLFNTIGWVYLLLGMTGIVRF